MDLPEIANDVEKVRDLIAATPRRWALFLDLDGTLLDIAERPEEVVVPPGLADHLDRVRVGLFGALAIVSGRPLVDIDRFLHPLRFDAASEHGSILRVSENGGDGVVSIAAAISGELVGTIERAIEGFEGVFVEAKKTAVSVHYRQAPGSGDELSRHLNRVLEAVGGDLRILPGRYVFEFVPSRVSKACAVEAFLASATFAGRMPVFFGDDATDEEACQLVERMGGVALRVAGERFSSREAAFQSAGHVREWITKLANAFRPAPASKPTQ